MDFLCDLRAFLRTHQGGGKDAAATVENKANLVATGFPEAGGLSLRSAQGKL